VPKNKILIFVAASRQQGVKMGCANKQNTCCINRFRQRSLAGKRPEICKYLGGAADWYAVSSKSCHKAAY
jgi:hypothetical protein